MARQTGFLTGRSGACRLFHRCQPGDDQKRPGDSLAPRPAAAGRPGTWPGRPASSPDGPAPAGCFTGAYRVMIRDAPATVWRHARRLPADPAHGPADRIPCRLVRRPARQAGFLAGWSGTQAGRPATSTTLLSWTSPTAGFQPAL